MRVLDWLATAALTASVAACTATGDVSYPNRKLFDVKIALWSQPSFAADLGGDGSPRADCNIILRAHATGEGSAEWQDATFYWYMGLDRTRPVDSTTASASDVHGSWANAGISPTQDERGGWQLSAGFPFDLKIVYRYELNTSHRVRSDSVRLTCGPAAPAGSVPHPALSLVELQPHSGPWQLGDTLGVHFQASSAAGLWLSYVQTTGALHADSLIGEQMVNTAEHAPRFPIPQSASIDTAIVADVYAVDIYGQAVRATLATSPILDLVPPALYDTARASIFPTAPTPALAGAYFVGDTMLISAHATDNHGLRTLGWHGMPGGYTDSIVVYGPTAYSGLLRIPVPSTWAGTPQLSFSATDLAGNTTTTAAPSGAFTVAPTLARPIATSVVGHQTGLALIDTGRSTVYVVQTDTQRIVELTLPGLQRTRTFELPGSLTSMDITPSGDSLVMTLGGQRALYFLDLGQAAPQPTVLPLALDSANGQGPVAVRVASNDRAYVGTAGATVNQSQILEVDLATGAQRIRTDFGSDVALLGRSLDQRVIAVGGGCVELYHAATDAFGPCTSMWVNGTVSLDGRGDRVTIGSDVFDSTITLLRQMPVPNQWEQYATALSADGAYLYECISWEGLVRARVSDGALLDRAIVPGLENCRMQISPDGTWALLTEGYVPPGAVDVATVDLRDANAQPVQFARASSRTGAALLRAPAKPARLGAPSTLSRPSWHARGVRPRAIPMPADARPSPTGDARPQEDRR